jgi:hypothetical protein
VVKSLYPAFRDYGYQAIPPSQGADPASLTDREKAFVRAIWDLYKGYSATALRKMTHKEAPWLDARGSLPPDAISDAEITPESMRAFFLPRVIKRLQQQGPRIDPTAWASSAEAIATGRARTTKDIRDELRRRRAGPNPG